MDNTPVARFKPRSLNLGFFNANGINGQRDEIAEFLRDHQIDILLVQETFLKPRRRNPSIANYRIVRNDRTRCHRGGTLIYYKKELYCIPMDPPALAQIEVSVCRLGMTGHQPITLVSAYLPPRTPAAENPHEISNDLSSLLGMSDSVIIAGDLNAKHPAWNSTKSSFRGRLLLDLSNTMNFDVIAPMTHTHFPHDPNHSPDVLDTALLKNVNLRLNSIETVHELTSDHRPVVMKLAPRIGLPDPTQPPATRKVTDWRKVGEMLKSNTSPQLDSIPEQFDSAADTVAAIDSLTDHVQTVLNDCSRQVPAEDNFRFKLPADVRDLMTEKNAATRAYSNFPCPANKSHMRYLQRKVSSRIAELREAGWDKTLSDLEPTHLAFWQLQRKLRSQQSAAMPPLVRPDTTIAFDDVDKAECLADSLEAQCSPSLLPVDQAHLTEIDAEVERRLAQPPVEDPDDPLPPVTPDEVHEIIKGLKTRKAPGSDGLTNRVVQLFPAHLIMLLTIIFNGALNNNIFPQTWKEATVIGIPKPGKPKSEPSSYRPISLLKVLGKIYERLIYKRLRDFAETKGLIPNEQFGFRTQHCSIHQAHRIVEHISESFMRGSLVGAVFFDIAKAFDKVWHNGLIYKLYQLGVPDRLVLILRDFLSNRTFRYRIEGALSSPRPIRAGVPQGSVISPLIFTLFTSDIPKSKKAQLALFADDTAIYSKGRCPDAIHHTLQASVDKLGEWFRKWRIEVNPDKSQAVLFSKPRRLPPLPEPLTMFGKPIPWEKQAKYLGVVLDNHLNFKEHIKQVRSRAAFALGRLHSILNAKSKLSLRCKLRIYTACIRPIMTYACVVFAHAGPHHIHRLQALQNRFLRKATGAPYYVRNVALHLDLKIPTIAQFMKRLSKRFFDSAAKHRNPLVVKAANYIPSRISRTRRPRHALTDPDDPITLLQESNRATSTVLKTKRRPTFRPRRRGPPRSRPRPQSDQTPPPRPLPDDPTPARADVVPSVVLNSPIQPVPTCCPPTSDALSRGPYPAGGALSEQSLSFS